jgi:hypothetical protein
MENPQNVQPSFNKVDSKSDIVIENTRSLKKHRRSHSDSMLILEEDPYSICDNCHKKILISAKNDHDMTCVTQSEPSVVTFVPKTKEKKATILAKSAGTKGINSNEKSKKPNTSEKNINLTVNNTPIRKTSKESTSPPKSSKKEKDVTIIPSISTTTTTTTTPSTTSSSCTTKSSLISTNFTPVSSISSTLPQSTPTKDSKRELNSNPTNSNAISVSPTKNLKKSSHNLTDSSKQLGIVCYFCSFIFCFVLFLFILFAVYLLIVAVFICYLCFIYFCLYFILFFVKFILFITMQ